MSRHRAFQNYDYQNDLEEYEGGYSDEEEGEQLSPEDQAQMNEATAEVQRALGNEASKVTVKQIQEALWHYYYDVDKSVTYLLSKYIAPPPPKPAKVKGPKPESAGKPVLLSLLSRRQAAVFCFAEAGRAASLPSMEFASVPEKVRPTSLTMSEGACQCGLESRKRLSYTALFSDMPWLNIPKEREAVFIAPFQPRGGLLGGGPEPKMSKLQALAAARKKKADEKKSEGKVQGTQDKMEKLSIQESGSESNQDPEQHPKKTSASKALRGEDAKPALGGLAKRRKLAQEQDVGPGTISSQLPQDASPATIQEVSSSVEIDTPTEARRLEDVEQLRAAPSAFAMTLAGSASAKQRRSPSQQFFLPPYMAYHPDLTSAFSGPSPDDVVLNAQAKAGKPKAAPAKKKGGGDVDSAMNGVKTLKVDDTPLPKSKNLDVLQEYEKKKSKRTASFVVVGHVDAGKSTLMGRLLLDLKVVDQRTIDKYRKEAETLGKSSFALAWVLDQGTEERTRGVTIDIATNRFETESTSFTILDAPGHRDFIPNMIAGASQADFAILVVDASTGAFESGLKGQTREHSLLIRSMGVSRVIVAVNKLDTVGWSRERFDEISHQVSGFLSATGFQAKNISFVPLSGLHGDNIVKRSGDPAVSWYTGPTLIEELENSEPMARALNKPLRMTVSEVYKTALSPLTISGRIDAGSLQNGDALLVQPSGEKAYVKALEVDTEPVEWAVAGQNVVIHLSNIDPIHVRVGDIICDPANPVNCIDTFTMKALAFDILMPMQVDVHRGRLHTGGQIQEISALLNKVTGAAIKKKPKIVKPASVARIVVKMASKVPLEPGQRVVLRSSGETVAAGLLE